MCLLTGGLIGLVLVQVEMNLESLKMTLYQELRVFIKVKTLETFEYLEYFEYFEYFEIFETEKLKNFARHWNLENCHLLA